MSDSSLIFTDDSFMEDEDVAYLREASKRIK